MIFGHIKSERYGDLILLSMSRTPVTFSKIADDNGFQILEYNTDKGHIHLLVNCSPQHYIPDMIKALKGVSARLLMKEFGEELKMKLWGGHLWNPSYFVATVSKNTEEQIRKYIQNQKRK